MVLNIFGGWFRIEIIWDFPNDLSQAHKTVAPSSIEQKRGRVSRHRECKLDAANDR